MLCFAAVEDGMPEPMSVPEAELRRALVDAGWRVTGMEVTIYWGVASVMAGFLAQFGLTPPTDEHDRIHVPVWKVEADRV
jgi:hypothetical protein